MKRMRILLAIVLLFSILPQSTMAFRDTEGTLYETPVRVLADLGILEGRSADYYEPDKTVSRAEAAAILVRLSGEIMADTTANFKDVPDSHWAYGYISSAYGMGIIDGMGDGGFAPDMAVSTEQFVKMLLCLAGYKTVAEAAGGYPSGYMIEATKNGVTEGIPTEKEASRGNIARMAYRFLEIPVLNNASYGDDSLRFTEGDSVLSHFLKIEKHTGIINADEKHAFKETQKTKEGFVRVEDMVFLKGAKDTAPYFGMNVVIYAKETEKEEKEILSVFPTASEKTFTLTTAEVQQNTTKTNLVFLRGAKDETETFPIAPAARLIQNGTEIKIWTPDALYTGSGVLTVISYRGDAADVLILDTYKTYVAESFSEGSMRIRLKPNSERKSTISVKEGDVYKTVLFEDENGQTIEPDSLKEWDALTVFEDTESKSIRIVCSSRRLTGTVTEIAGTTLLRVEDTFYKTADSFFADYSAAPGKRYVFSLDMFNKIAALVETESENTAYAYAMQLHKEKGLSGKVYLKLLTEKEGVGVFKIADAVRLNDVHMPASLLQTPGEASSLQREEIDKLASNGAVKEQLLIIEKNAQNEITAIETAEDGSMLSTDAERESVFSLDKKDESGQLIRAGMLCQMASKYYVKDTKIFNVAESYTGDNEDKYTVKDISYLMHGGGYNHFDLYDLDSVNRPKVMVMRALKNDTDVYTKGEYGVVVSKGEGLTSDGMTCATISVWTPDAAEPKLYYDVNKVDAIYKTSVISHPKTDSLGLPDTVKLADIDVGDVVRVMADSKGVIEKIAVLFRHKTPQVAEKSYKYGVSTPDVDDYHDLLWVYVRVTAANAGIYKYTNPRERIHTYVEGETLILTFDTKRNKAEKADANVIEPGVLLFSVRGGANEKLIVIYK